MPAPDTGCSVCYGPSCQGPERTSLVFVCVRVCARARQIELDDACVKARRRRASANTHDNRHAHTRTSSLQVCANFWLRRVRLKCVRIKALALIIIAIRRSHSETTAIVLYGKCYRSASISCQPDACHCSQHSVTSVEAGERSF